jgi:DNA-binding NarL/FixJ family response regulator
MVKSPSIRLVLVDDHPVFLEGLAQALTRQPDLAVVGQGSDAADALALWEKHRPDVLLLDLAMSGLHGLDALARIRQRHPQARVLMLTSSDDGDDAVAALDAGAAGYITKAARYDELVAAIHEVHAGGRPIGEAVARRLAARDRGGPLTPREMEVLGHLREGLTYKEIGQRLGIAQRTARAHVVAVKEKLSAVNIAQAVARGFERGLLRSPRPDGRSANGSDSGGL